MWGMNADGRFAPSPTGPLHLGSLRTALVAWLSARTQSARFVLRVEDLDPQRSRPEFESSQLEDLASLGIDWDGEVLHQSTRRLAYEEALSELRRQDRVYPCFCTRAEIREAASAPHGEYPEGAYPGTCRELSEAERRSRERSGRPYALRLRVDGERIEFTDGILGEQATRVDDFVVRRADGVPAYQLAVVVDDAAQEIGQVVRGADLVTSTPRQLLLYRLLGLPVPSFSHVPLVLGPDGTRLAKRHGAVTLADRADASEDVLAQLAHSLGMADGRERFDRARELLSEFDPRRLPKEPVTLG
jgi:glutamyl-tRNA synthetase